MNAIVSLVWRILFGGAIVLAIALFALSLSIRLIMCGTRNIRDIPSADGRYLARFREYNCGATTAGTTAVELWDRRSGPDLLVENRRIVFAAKGINLDTGFVVRWDGPRQFHITSPRPPVSPVVWSWRDVSLEVVGPGLP